MKKKEEERKRKSRGGNLNAGCETEINKILKRNSFLHNKFSHLFGLSLRLKLGRHSDIKINGVNRG